MNDYIKNTASAFDKIAGNYDENDSRNPVLQWMRGIVHKVYSKNIERGHRVLELNCGTGEDAVFLASGGINVYATDISPKMVDVLKTKAAEYVTSGLVKCTVKSFDEINSVNESGFDCVVSNFGGLNCINDFAKLSFDIYNKLKPDGKFIAVVMNRFCPWEMFYYLMKLDLKNAFRRFNMSGIDADLNGMKVRTFYFSPKQFARSFIGQFVTEKIYTLGYFTPPPYLSKIYVELTTLTKLLMKLDELVMGVYPFSRAGDHFIIVMRKK